MPDLEFVTNQAICPARYLAGLAECFDGWGSQDDYTWTFQRDSGAGPADMIAARVDAELVGGSAVVYRVVADARGRRAVVGIMCGSWTVPTARGQGCFSGMIQESLRLSATRGASLLMAFVTGTNSSRRRLEAAGARLTPSGYCVANPRPVSAQPPLAAGEAPSSLHQVQSEQQLHVHFRFPTLETWAAQHVTRSLPTGFVALPSGATALVESAEDTDRVLALYGSTDRLADLATLSAGSSRHGRKTFFFSTDPLELAAAPSAGFSVIPGFLTTLVADPDAFVSWTGVPARTGATPPEMPWRIEHGNRM